MGNYDDALLHLRETETMLRSVDEEAGKVTKELREAAEQRNLQLAKQAKTYIEEKKIEAAKPQVKPNSEAAGDSTKTLNKRDRIFNAVLLTGAFAIGFIGAKFALQKYRSNN